MVKLLPAKPGGIRCLVPIEAQHQNWRVGLVFPIPTCEEGGDAKVWRSVFVSEETVCTYGIATADFCITEKNLRAEVGLGGRKIASPAESLRVYQ